MRNFISAAVGIVLLAAVWAACFGADDPDQPSADEVLEMNCRELEQSWQSHRRGEWDAPGTYNLLLDQIEARC